MLINMRNFKIFFFICLSFEGFSQTVFTVKDSSGIEQSLNITTFNKARVYLFLSPECPLCQNYTLVLNNLYTKYKVLGVEMIGIVSSKSFNNIDVKEFTNKYNIHFPLLLNNNLLAKYFDASITPETIVTDSLGNKIYQGRIDNWAYDIGKKRKQATVFDLNDALDFFIKNQKRPFYRTKAIGCFIE